MGFQLPTSTGFLAGFLVAINSSARQPVVLPIVNCYSPLVGEDSQFDSYFSSGLVQPPTGYVSFSGNISMGKISPRIFSRQILVALSSRSGLVARVVGKSSRIDISIAPVPPWRCANRSMGLVGWGDGRFFGTGWGLGISREWCQSWGFT